MRINARLGLGRLVPLLALAAVLASPGDALPQEGEEEFSGPDPFAQSPPLYFLERNYVFVTFPHDDLAIEAQISPHITLFQNLTSRQVTDWATVDLNDLPFVYRGGSAWAVTLSPMVRARILTRYSAPVRIPSYLPHLNVQWFRVPKNQHRWPRSPRPVIMTSALLAIGHHSNGQDGCILQGLERPEGECRDVAPEDVGALPANTHDGSFSTNYIRLGAYRKYMYLDDNHLATHSVWGGAVFETHPAWLKIGGVMEGPLRDVYGTNRLRAEGGYEQLNHSKVLGLSNTLLRLEGSVGHIFKDVGVGSSRWTARVEAALTHYESGTGAFARYYYGQDYYNIHFMENLSRLEIGLTLDQGRLPRFQTIPRQSRPRTDEMACCAGPYF